MAGALVRNGRPSCSLESEDATLSIDPDHRAGKWQRVSAKYSCPICGKPDWCSVSADGRLAVCRRIEQGAFRTKKDKTGSIYYLHRLAGAESPTAPPPPSAGLGSHARANADMLHTVNSALLARLSLSPTHRADLQRRGMPDAEIDARQYRTLPVQGRARLAGELHERFGDAVLTVPGIISRERDGRRYPTLAGAAGLVIPVRDVAGRIVALKIRRDDAAEGGERYSYMSSAKYGGPGSGAPIHVPAGVSTAEIVGLTEGELKADVASVLSGVPTISIPGVASWRGCLPILKALGCKIVRLRLDIDAKDKPTVARALDAVARGLDAEGFALELERWPAEFKGVDNALAAGATVEILRGDSARQTIAEIVAEGTAGEASQEASPLARLGEVLAEGAEALFHDHDLLRALAQLAETDPAEWACVRARLRAAGIRLRELDAAIARLRQEIRAANPPPSTAGEYRISGGRIVHVRPTLQGAVEVPLCNFWVRIVQTVRRDDGAESSTAFAVEGAQVDGRPLPRAIIKASDFPRMDWPTSAWGGLAVVYAGMGTRDHLRCAIELLSIDRAERVEYMHTGWREVGGRWFYLHAAGAIGNDGPADGVVVALPAALSGFTLPKPPDGDSLRNAIRASLRLLDLGQACLMFPLLAGVYRSVLGPCDFGLHTCGITGTFKTETAALFQQHLGAGLDARHLPASWSSTGNALELLAFTAKDALLVVDDFAPAGSTSDVQRFNREADRVFRAQGNAAGRARLSSDALLRQGKPPRGLILSTGEDIPRLQSVRARLLVLEFTAGDIDVAKLTACQKDAAAGLYATAMAGFVRSLAPRYADVRGQLRAEVADLRESALTGTAHRRTPEIVSNLYLGLRHFLDFAETVGAIDAEHKADLLKRAWRALGEAAAAQADHLHTADPVGQFLRLLAAAIACGRAHCAAPNGDAPENATAWGWREREIRTGGDSRIEYQPQGTRIGWIEGTDLLLEPEASYAVVQDLARVQGDSLPVSGPTLRRRLKERGLLVTHEQGKLLTRRTLDGQRRFVLHLGVGVIPQEEGESGEQGDHPEKHADSCPFQSPYFAADGLQSGHKKGQEILETEAPGSVPLIPPIGSGIGGPAAGEYPRAVCRYPQHRRRWVSVHGAVLCGICAPPCRADVVAKWLDGAPDVNEDR
jgi:hypothetical protein